tara:strand:- start:201 stop:332 length:132 start_codon:yes stop_codon:yes gene_type:complete
MIEPQDEYPEFITNIIDKLESGRNSLEILIEEIHEIKMIIFIK